MPEKEVGKHKQYNQFIGSNNFAPASITFFFHIPIAFMGDLLNQHISTWWFFITLWKSVADSSSGKTRGGAGAGAELSVEWSRIYWLDFWTSGSDSISC